MKTRSHLLIAWLVHAYTASGGVLGLFALFAAAEGETRRAFLLLMVAMVVDATDGILARRAHVKVHLPHFSGARLDDAVDVLTYIYVPLFILVQERLLPHAAWIAIPALAGFYAYGQSGMKTKDHYFLGFPSYWNVVALYLFWLRPAPIVALVCVAVPAVLTFIPTRYLYPSRNAVFWRTNFALGSAWLALVCWLLLQPAPPQLLVWLSLGYPALYMALSFLMEYRLRTTTREAARGDGR